MLYYCVIYELFLSVYLSLFGFFIKIWFLYNFFCGICEFGIVFIEFVINVIVFIIIFNIICSRDSMIRIVLVKWN